MRTALQNTLRAISQPSFSGLRANAAARTARFAAPPSCLPLARRTLATSAEPRTIVVIPGDFVGAEVTPYGVACLESVVASSPSIRDVQFVYKEAGGAAIDKYGTTLPDDTFEACKKAWAVFFGSVGGPKWTGVHTDNPFLRPEWALLTLRKEMQLFANIRPCIFPSKSLYDVSPLKKEVCEGVEFIVLRENSGGCYFGKRQEDNGFDGK